MSDTAILIEVHLHDDRWHGVGDWPPSPARLFQALVAGAGRGGALSEGDRAALKWLEQIEDAPTIAVPSSIEAKGYTTFVPNNDLDAVGGDARRIGEIRAGKTIKPRLFRSDAVFLYAWHFSAGPEADTHAPTICAIAERLYQFGRGVDMAYATADLLTNEEPEAWLTRYPGPFWRPAGKTASGGTPLRCPAPGTLQSLVERHNDQRNRISGNLLRQPRQLMFRLVGYNCPADLLLFDLTPHARQRRFQSWPLARAAELATLIRDAAACRLRQAMPHDEIERALIGRGATEADKSRRVRIIPLPSIGGAHTDPSIRRVLIERPPDCPIRADDLSWAFSGLDSLPTRRRAKLNAMASRFSLPPTTVRCFSITGWRATPGRGPGGRSPRPPCRFFARAVVSAEWDATRTRARWHTRCARPCATLESPQRRRRSECSGSRSTAKGHGLKHLLKGPASRRSASGMWR